MLIMMLMLIIILCGNELKSVDNDDNFSTDDDNAYGDESDFLK